MKNENVHYDSIVINSNRWFSAVTDYSLQLARYLKSANKQVLYCADKRKSPMPAICIKNSIPFMNIPLNNPTVTGFFVSFFTFVSLLLKQKKVKTIFVFEGRELTHAALSKMFFPFLWKGKKLIRIRGQAQSPKKHVFHFLMYRFLADQIIYASSSVERCVPFRLPHGRSKICYYGKTEQFPTQTLSEYHFEKQNYTLHFSSNIITFFMLGRFDPVKGHNFLFEAFSKANFDNTPTQLICVGTRQSVSADDLYEKYKKLNIFQNSNSFKRDWLYCLSTEDERKKIILIETQFSDALLFMKNATFGVISSLGSETICRVGVEFLQAEVPVLYADAGALPEVFARFPEFKFKCGNVNELTRKFEFASRLFQNKENYLREKEKSHALWEENYRGDVYSQFCSFYL